MTAAIREGLATVESLDYGPVAVQISGAYKRILKARQARPQRVEVRERAPRRGRRVPETDRIAGLAR